VSSNPIRENSNLGKAEVTGSSPVISSNPQPFGVVFLLPQKKSQLFSIDDWSWIDASLNAAPFYIIPVLITGLFLLRNLCISYITRNPV